PGLVLPVVAVISLLACVALKWLEPEDAAVAALVALPAAWNYSVVLALPCIVALWRDERPRAPAMLVVAAASFGVPLASVILRLWSGLLPHAAGSAGPMAAVLMAIQPAG